MKDLKKCPTKDIYFTLQSNSTEYNKVIHFMAKNA